jgi:hypothetical protein
MTIEKVLLETKAVKQLVERIVAERERETAQRVERETAQRVERETLRREVSRLLAERFGPVPEDVTARLRDIQQQPKLSDLLLVAALCPDLEAFRTALIQP